MHQVEIIGAPVACKDGVQETWRDVAGWVTSQLKARYGDQVHVQYYDLFDPRCPAIPAEGQLPVVMVDGKVISCGGKISVPLIRKTIDQARKVRFSAR